jgi:hypothetical protein
MENNVEEIAMELENIVARLLEMGCHGSITMERNGRIEVLTSCVPNGNAVYKKTSSGNSFPIQKEVQFGNVVFFDYLTEAEAKAEMFGKAD